MNRFIKSLVSLALCGCLSLVSLGSVAAAQPLSSVGGLDKMYGIGSVSKVFTAASVMKLVDDGKVALDESITTYIPDFTMVDPRYVEITPRMLLNHSAGLLGTSDNNAMLLGDNDTFTHDQLLTRLQAQRLKHAPGELSVYSNDSYTLAEILVERVSGLTFTQFLELHFEKPLGLKTFKTPQSDFDRSLLAPIYLKESPLQSENVNMIGTGGIYATMEDLCRLSTIFMDDGQLGILSQASVDEMASNQHQSPLVDKNSDSVFHYGLGWDSVETYPFNTYGIKALAKGGDTLTYHTNLTVLPEYQLAASVSSSGGAPLSQLIAQEIILEVLKEEGIIESTVLELPDFTAEKQTIPQELKRFAGLYDTGFSHFTQVAFTENTMQMTSIGTDHPRTVDFDYIGNGEFLSTHGEYMQRGLVSAQGGTRGVSKLSFIESLGGQYINAATYESVAGLSQTASTWPVAQKVEPNVISNQLTELWSSRAGKNYLLISEKYSSQSYLSAPVARICLDASAPGYVMQGLYEAEGKFIRNARIIDENTALGYQNTPTMMGRDVNDITFAIEGSAEVLGVNAYRYIDEASILSASDVGDSLSTQTHAVWLRVDEKSKGERWSITVPNTASYFVYDDKLNCIATSLEMVNKPFVTLPEKGYIAFVGDKADFQIAKQVNTYSR